MLLLVLSALVTAKVKENLKLCPAYNEKAPLSGQIELDLHAHVYS